MKEIGKIVSVHGVDGDLVIAHYISNQHAIKNLQVLMLEVWEGSFIPFFIEKIKGISNDDFILKFEEISSREAAKAFLNKRVYVFDGKSIETSSEEEWGYLAGYERTDQHGHSIGKIAKILSHGMQMLIELNYRGRETHIPLHPDLVMSIDKEKSTIQLQIADGLLEMWE
jgi:16S rRNA processing protein RimM